MLIAVRSHIISRAPMLSPPGFSASKADLKVRQTLHEPSNRYLIEFLRRRQLSRKLPATELN